MVLEIFDCDKNIRVFSLHFKQKIISKIVLCRQHYLSEPQNEGCKSPAACQPRLAILVSEREQEIYKENPNKYSKELI